MHCEKYRNFTWFPDVEILGKSESLKTMWKLCLSANFLHQEIRWNYYSFRSDGFRIIRWMVNAEKFVLQWAQPNLLIFNYVALFLWEAIVRKCLGLKLITNSILTNMWKPYAVKLITERRALTRVTPYMSVKKKKMLMNSFFIAQLNCCTLIWMLHCRRDNNVIRNLHWRCLSLI